MAAKPPSRRGCWGRWGRSAAVLAVLLCGMGLILLLRSWALQTPFPPIPTSLGINIQNHPVMLTKVFILIHHNRTASNWRTKTTITALGRLGFHDVELVHGRPTAEEVARYPCFAAISRPCEKVQVILKTLYIKYITL